MEKKDCKDKATVSNVDLLVPADFRADSWSVSELNSKYILEYISGELGGRLKTLEITKDEYNLVCNGELDADALCIKYKVT